MTPSVDEVMVITSIEKNNLPILGLCASIGCRVGIGSENDVLDRYYQSAKLLDPEYVIRITADCPCFDPELLELAIQSMSSGDDYCGMLSNMFADGLDLEIMKFSALKRAWKEANHTFEREHVTQYIVRHPETFRLYNFVSPIGDFGNDRWTVDEPEDYELVKRIYEHFLVEEHSDHFGYRDILYYLDAHPEIRSINAKFTRNEGLEKSIKKDKIVDIQE